MTKKLEPVRPLQTLEEFDAVLEKYKKDNPVKYKAKLEAGEFDKFRAVLGGKVAKPEVKLKK